MIGIIKHHLPKNISVETRTLSREEYTEAKEWIKREGLAARSRMEDGDAWGYPAYKELELTKHGVAEFVFLFALEEEAIHFKMVWG